MGWENFQPLRVTSMAAQSQDWRSMLYCCGSVGAVRRWTCFMRLSVPWISASILRIAEGSMAGETLSALFSASVDSQV